MANPFQNDHEFWWSHPRSKEPDDQLNLASAIFSSCETIENEQSAMRANWRQYAKHYSNRNELGLYWGDASQSDSFESLVTENVVKSVIDTATSIIAKNRVRVRVLTNGALWSEQRKARKLEKYVYAEMHARALWDLGPEVFRDACVFGTGVVKVIGDDKKKCVKYERVLIDEIVVNEAQALRGNPRELFQRRLVDKDQLIKQFPQYEEEIRDSAKRRYWCDRHIPDNQVMVVEAYRLGQRKVVAVDKAVLSDEKFDEDLPFVFLRWDGRPITGFYGLGLARDLWGYQVRINQLNNFIQRCQDLIAVPRIFVDVASKVLKIQIDNKIGAIIPYRGKPPTFFTPQALNAEIYNYKEQLIAAAFRFAGISQLSAQSLKPAGLESAVALREFTDIENQRFVIQSQRYERFFVELGMGTIRTAASIFSDSDTVRFSERTVVHEIKWSQINLEDDRFDLDIQPASLLSMSPAARLQAVTELAQVGQLSPAEVRYLLQHPDLESSHNLANAKWEAIMQIKETLFDGEYVAPEPFLDLNLTMQQIELAYLEAKLANAPEEILENIRTFLVQTNDLSQQSQAATMQPTPPVDPAAAGGAPIATGAVGGDVVGNLPGQIMGAV